MTQPYARGIQVLAHSIDFAHNSLRRGIVGGDYFYIYRSRVLTYRGMRALAVRELIP